jgi:release factor glutamine methyltransferase
MEKAGIKQMGKMEIEQGLNESYEQKLRHIKSVLEKSQEFQEDFYTVRTCGLDIAVFKNVFSPSYFEDSAYFANNMPNVEGLHVLEIGTGTGLIALKLAMGKAKKVVATDINPDAIKNAEHNVKRYNMEAVIDLRPPADIFRAVIGEKFDLIFWNIPFCYVDAVSESEIGLPENISELEKAVFNPYYKYMFDYLNKGFDHLNAKGKLILGFSPTIGREDVLDDLCAHFDLVKTVLREDGVEIDGELEILQILEFSKRHD